MSAAGAMTTTQTVLVTLEAGHIDIIYGIYGSALKQLLKSRLNGHV